jgi:hypothetical protein
VRALAQLTLRWVECGCTTDNGCRVACILTIHDDVAIYFPACATREFNEA